MNSPIFSSFARVAGSSIAFASASSSFWRTGSGRPGGPTTAERLRALNP